MVGALAVTMELGPLEPPMNSQGSRAYGRWVYVFYLKKARSPGGASTTPTLELEDVAPGRAMASTG